MFIYSKICFALRDDADLKIINERSIIGFARVTFLT